MWRNFALIMAGIAVYLAFVGWMSIREKNQAIELAQRVAVAPMASDSPRPDLRRTYPVITGGAGGAGPMPNNADGGAGGRVQISGGDAGDSTGNGGTVTIERESVDQLMKRCQKLENWKTKDEARAYFGCMEIPVVNVCAQDDESRQIRADLERINGRAVQCP